MSSSPSLPSEEPSRSSGAIEDDSKFQLTLAHVLTLALMEGFVGWMIARGFSPAVALASAAGCAGIVVGMCATPRMARKFAKILKAMN